MMDVIEEPESLNPVDAGLWRPGRSGGDGEGRKP